MLITEHAHDLWLVLKNVERERNMTFDKLVSARIDYLGNIEFYNVFQ